jgi:hypothetical protein
MVLIFTRSDIRLSGLYRCPVRGMLVDAFATGLYETQRVDTQDKRESGAAAREDGQKLDRTLHQDMVFAMTRAGGLFFLVLSVRLTEATSAEASACRNIGRLAASPRVCRAGKRYNR